MAKPTVTALSQGRPHWVEAADYRHGVEGPRPNVGDEVETLCGATVTVIVPRPGMFAPECQDCDGTWRHAEKIPQRSEDLRDMARSFGARRNSTKGSKKGK
jgi:hypothetical protein